MSTTRKKPGPKPKPARDRCSELLHVKVTKAERAAILATVGRGSFSAWARGVLVGATKGNS
jgi:hypothetical protein